MNDDDKTPESKDQPDEDQTELTEEQKAALRRKGEGSIDGFVAPADDDIIIKNE